MRYLPEGASHDEARPADEGTFGVTRRESEEMANKQPRKLAAVLSASSEHSIPSNYKYHLVVFVCLFFTSV